MRHSEGALTPRGALHTPAELDAEEMKIEGEETRELPIALWDTMGWAENAYAMGELNVLLDGHLGDRFPLETSGVSCSQGVLLAASAALYLTFPFCSVPLRCVPL